MFLVTSGVGCFMFFELFRCCFGVLDLAYGWFPFVSPFAPFSDSVEPYYLLKKKIKMSVFNKKIKMSIF